LVQLLEVKKKKRSRWTAYQGPDLCCISINLWDGLVKTESELASRTKRGTATYLLFCYIVTTALFPCGEESYNTGTQVTFTYQKHIVDELFLYASAGYGEFVSETRNLSLLGSSIRLNQSNGNYLVIGAGMSQELNLNKSGRFTVQFIEGLKYAHLIYENGPFESKTFRFVFSPGSLLDMNINFGFKF